MTTPIKKGEIEQAPTPQNTPASVSGSYLNKAQPPSIPTTIKEDEELRQKLLTNPVLLSAIQGKLNTLIGQDSGYFDQLPMIVKNRVYGLKSLQEEQLKLDMDFQRELFELEKKYQKKLKPLYESRRELVKGLKEPSKQQIEDGKKLVEGEDDDEPKEDKIEEVEETAEEDSEGIPSFWLTALENLNPVSDLISDRDADALKFLDNVRMEYLTTPGFKLILEFKPNEFFKNEELTKTYYYQKELGYSGDFIYDHAEGCEIDWKDNEHNVTITVETRKQRNKHTMQVRTIKKLTPIDSFFNFFDPPKPPASDEDGEEEKEDKDASAQNAENEGDEEGDEGEGDTDLEQRLQMDYEVGELIKDKLIPRAVDWFTGEALQYEYDNGEEEEDDEFNEEDEEEEEDEEDEDESKEGDDADHTKKATKVQPQECKQQ